MMLDPARPAPSLQVLIPETGPVTERVRVRETGDDEGGRRLVRIIRRGSGSVVSWRRAQMVLVFAHGRAIARPRSGGGTMMTALQVRSYRWADGAVACSERAEKATNGCHPAS